MTIAKSEALLAELEQVRQMTGAASVELLRCEDVVAFAADPTTSLHGRFTWDDTEAAHQYRLAEARQLLRVLVTVLPSCDKAVPVYVSLRSDRHREGGGYRRTADVLSDVEMRRKLLDDALADLRTFRRKYATIQELFGVFEAIDNVALQPMAPAVAV